MSLKWTIPILVAPWGFFLLSGCITNPDLGDVSGIFSQEFKPARLETKVRLELGPGLLSLAKLGINLTDSQAKEYLSDIRKIELGVYDISGLPSLNKVWEKVSPRMAQEGWQILVKSKDKTNMSLIFYRLKRKGRGWLYLINLDQTKLVLVKVEGKLERLIEKALQEERWNSSPHYRIKQSSF